MPPLKGEENASAPAIAYATTRRLTRIKPNFHGDHRAKLAFALLPPPNPNRLGEGGLRTRGYFKPVDSDQPIVSLITVILNGEKYLEQTLHSVIKQTYDNVEYLVVDGGSRDGTLDILRKYDQQIDYWVSEPDQGLYSAMNKGLSLSSGEIIAFINVGDWLELDTCSQVVDKLGQGMDFLATAIRVFGDDDQPIGLYLPQAIDKIDLSSRLAMPFPHPGLFVRRKVYERIGGYNLRYRSAGDMEFALRMLSAETMGATDNKPTANFRMNGLSSRFRGAWEVREIAVKYGRSPTAAFFSLCSSLARKSLANYLPAGLVRLITKHKKGPYVKEYPYEP